MRSRLAKPELVWMAVHFGPNVDVAAVRALMLNLISDRQTGRLVFEVESSGEGMTWRVGASNPHVIRRLAMTHLNDVTLANANRRHPEHFKSWRLKACSLGLIVAPKSLETASASLMGAIAVTGSARVVQQMVVGQRLSPERVPNRTRALQGHTWTQQLRSAATVGTQPLDTDLRREIAAKRAVPGAVVTVRLGIYDPDARYRRLPAGVMAAWRSMTAANVRLDLHKEHSRRLIAADPRANGIRLNVDEMLAVLSWPYGERSYPRVDRDRSIRLPVTTRSRTGRMIGLSTYPGQRERQLRLSASDALRHMVVTGPTGVGKSTLLASMALADIEAGRSVVVIDPKADLVDDLLARIPDEHLYESLVVVGFRVAGGPPFGEPSA